MLCQLSSSLCKSWHLSQMHLLVLNRANFGTCTVLAAKRWKQKSKLPFQSDLRNPVSEVYGGLEETQEKGHVYDKKPFKVSVEKYQTFDWCGCGLSNAQPFCDGTHTSKYVVN